jgi:peptidoglycan/xylan/chitin deacetylase (PgdA/CDA1 family)
VIYYHGVTDEYEANFEKQIAYLSEHCEVVSPLKILNRFATNSRHVVAVIFDDAFVSFQRNALPVLQRYDVPAAVAVPVAYLGHKPNWEIKDNSVLDEFVMDEKSIVGLDRLGFEIFSHTLTHRALTELNDSQLDKELFGSKQGLERIIGHEVSGISYPYGACNEKVCKAAAKAGYRFGFSIDPLAVDRSVDILRIGRFMVLPNDGILKLKLITNGAYQVLVVFRWLKRIFLRS